jgi:hypothetical protein
MLTNAGDRAATFGLWGTIALGVTAILRLFAQSYAMHGPGDARNAAMIGTMLARTLWGWGWLIQVVGLAIALAGFAPARRGAKAGWLVAALSMLAFFVHA